MTSLVLHIGSPKAGSSAIQASLADLAASHRPWGPLQPWLPLPPNPYGRPYPSGFIAGLYLEPQALPRYLRESCQANPRAFGRDCDRYRRRLRRWLQPRLRRRPAGALLSCEYLWRFPRQAVATLRQDFEALGIQRFLVVAYVREPSSAYGSALQQWARLSTDFSRFDPQTWRYELRQRLETWAEVFPGDLVVRPFDRQQLPDGCVVQDLQQQIQAWCGNGVAPPGLRPVAAVNRSASAEELVAMQELMGRPSAQSPADGVGRSRVLGRLWDSVAAVAAAGNGSAIRVQPAVAAVIRERHRVDLDWLATVHGIALPTPTTHEPAAESWPLPGRDASQFGLDDLLQPPTDSALLERLRQHLAQVQLPGP